MSVILRGYRFFRNLPASLNKIRSDVQGLEANLYKLSVNTTAARDELSKTLDALGANVEVIKQQQADLSHGVASIKRPRKSIQTVMSGQGGAALQADNHALDGYYVAFENKFRGSETEIYDRLAETYTPIFMKEIPSNLRKLPIIDIGCGRGELLKLLKDLGLSGMGIDINKAMVDKCIQKGYEAKETDALLYLREQPSASLAAVVGIHIVEHVPFEYLLALLQECFRTIAPGGTVVFETPNAENVVVGSLTFWYDSSHLKPVPPDALAFALEYAGFSKTKILRLHPDESLPLSGRSSMVQKIAAKMFGPRDYAAIGTKAPVK